MVPGHRGSELHMLLNGGFDSRKKRGKSARDSKDTRSQRTQGPFCFPGCYFPFYSHYNLPENRSPAQKHPVPTQTPYLILYTQICVDPAIPLMLRKQS